MAQIVLHIVQFNPKSPHGNLAPIPQVYFIDLVIVFSVNYHKSYLFNSSVQTHRQNDIFEFSTFPTKNRYQLLHRKRSMFHVWCICRSNCAAKPARLCICRSNCAAKPARLSIDSAGIEQWFRPNWAEFPHWLNYRNIWRIVQQNGSILSLETHKAINLGFGQSPMSRRLYQMSFLPSIFPNICSIILHAQPSRKPCSKWAVAMLNLGRNTHLMP